MISNCYLDSEGESAWQDSPPIFMHTGFQSTSLLRYR